MTAECFTSRCFQKRARKGGGAPTERQPSPESTAVDSRLGNPSLETSRCFKISQSDQYKRNDPFLLFR